MKKLLIEDIKRIKELMYEQSEWLDLDDTDSIFVDGELSEEDAAAGSTGYPTVTKWETGLTRSVANQIDPKSTWKSLNKITRGKANTLL